MDIESDPNSIVFNEKLKQYFKVDYLINIIRKLLIFLELHDIEVGINIVEPDEIKELNNSYRDIDKTTNVLSFALLEKRKEQFTPVKFRDSLQKQLDSGIRPILIGDIVISSFELAVSKDDTQKTNHFLKLLIHGLLHLLGYNHDVDERLEQMQAYEGQCYNYLIKGRKNNVRN